MRAAKAIVFVVAWLSAITAMWGVLLDMYPEGITYVHILISILIFATISVIAEADMKRPEPDDE